MKNLENLGRKLSSEEMKQVEGGSTLICTGTVTCTSGSNTVVVPWTQSSPFPKNWTDYRCPVGYIPGYVQYIECHTV